MDPQTTTAPTALVVITPSGLAVELTIGETYRGTAGITRVAIPARSLSGDTARLVEAPAGAPAGVTHCFRCGPAVVGITADQADLIVAAVAAKQAELDTVPILGVDSPPVSTDLRAERRALAAAESNSYSPDHFPGSGEWQAHRRAELALDAFDAAHPEIIAAIRAERAAPAPPAYITDPSSFYNRALRGED